VWKHAQAKDAQNGFLNCLLPTEVASAIGFRIDEIETEILHASWASEFSHSLALQLPICFEVGALSGSLVSSTPE
jgi:hypothetical protein